MTKTPIVGSIVHYQAYGTPNGEYPSVERAAIVTQVLNKDIPDGHVPNLGLAIMNPTGMFFNPNIPYSEIPKPGHWNYPTTN